MHKKYTFSDDKLTVYNGRLAKSKTINLDDITSCRPVTSVFGMVRYLLVTYGNPEKIEAVQPDNERAFVDCLNKRKNEINS